MTETCWEWIIGKVDRNQRYFELKYGKNPSPVARVGISENQKFIVEFLISHESDLNYIEEVFKEVIYEIELYLINTSEPDPLNYMINHTRKCANLHSRVHWVYYPKGAKKSIQLEKKNNFSKSEWGIKRFFSKN